ncbi:MAG TPA: TetR/AcrR family transcriptional regulator [Rariglobus sp.]|jgi:AcrR family transcriptional regulator|nr:TetR/AcrR family transcriptional regulator [Rariglobus sp.]
MTPDCQSTILCAARKRFQQFGYTKTSMQEIAADCGMSAANLYRFYEGKLDIGTAVLARELNKVHDACDSALASAGSELASQLTAFFHAIIDTTRKQQRNAPLLSDLFITVVRIQPRVRVEFVATLKQKVAALVAQAQSNRQIRTGDPGEQADLILVACLAFVLPRLIIIEPLGDPRPQVVAVIDCLIAGLAVKK